MKRKNIAKAVREQSSSYRDTWKAIEDTLFSAELVPNLLDEHRRMRCHYRLRLQHLI